MSAKAQRRRAKEIKKEFCEYPHMMEIFSPPRIAEDAKRQGLSVTSPGSLDLITGWDFWKQSDRELARRIVSEQKPWCVFFAPVCKAFSTLMRSNVLRMDPQRLEQIRKEALAMWAFCAELALMQAESGRVFVIEQPATASSWKTEVSQL